MNEKTALITGASSGIGYQLSRLLAKDGYNLVLVARNKEKLMQVKQELESDFGVKTKIIPKDLSLPEASNEIFTEIEGNDIEISVLVNNAGFDVHGAFLNTDLLEELNMIDVNIVSLTKLTKLFLPQMKKQGFGKILNVSSVAAYVPGAFHNVYSATKAYVLSFSEGLAEELDGTGITVTALCPGATRTGFTKRAKCEDIKLFQSHVMDAKEVAEIGYDALIKNKRVVIPGLYNKTQISMSKVLPRKRIAKMAKRLGQR